ncbi:MAG: hypothetical protein WC052_03675 [Patescibacteria group bacterium]|jgi:hypothetical protein
MYFRNGLKETAIDSLSKAASFLEKTKDDPFSWKWYIIAVHHSLYCFMILALSNSDQSGIWDEKYKSKKKQITFPNEDKKLIDFKTAYAWIQDKQRMGGYINAKPFVPLPYHSDSIIEHLNYRLRNRLIHYAPVSWSLSWEYLIQVTLPCLEVVEFLALQCGRFPMEENEREEVTRNLVVLRETAKHYLPK